MSCRELVLCVAYEKLIIVVVPSLAQASTLVTTIFSCRSSRHPSRCCRWRRSSRSSSSPTRGIKSVSGNEGKVEGEGENRREKSEIWFCPLYINLFFYLRSFVWASRWKQFILLCVGHPTPTIWFFCVGQTDENL